MLAYKMNTLAAMCHVNKALLSALVFLFATFHSTTTVAQLSNTETDTKKSKSTQVRGKGIKFSSTYTTLNAANCNLLKSKNTLQAEPPQICKGFEDYKVLISHQGVVTQLFIGRAQTNKIEDWDVSLLTTFIANSDTRSASYRQVIEWRLANGKPFAAIVRAQYDRKIVEPEATGRINDIVAKNLNGFRTINVVVNASKTRNANQAVRRLTDSAFLSEQ
jgi:hypothetical protein